MKSEEYFETYLKNEGRIEKDLRKLGIYDQDLMSDTMVDLHDWLQTNEPKKNFVRLFAQFYYIRWLRAMDYARHFDPCDYETLVRLSDGEQGKDEREYAQRVADKVDAILDFVETHTFRGERCPGTARRIFEMWLQGYTYREMEEAIGCNQGNISAYLRRMKKNIKESLVNTSE